MARHPKWDIDGKAKAAMRSFVPAPPPPTTLTQELTEAELMIGYGADPADIPEEPEDR